MALFDKQLESLTEDDLLSLVENQVREGYQIEYKQAVSFKEKQDKLDFLAGITSFANTVGGDFLIGVSETSGLPVSVLGWDAVDVDREKQRIENLLRDSVEPRLSCNLREIRLRNGKSVLVIRVPWSWAQPHMVRVEQVNRFYYRHSAGKDIMNVAQLRAAFALTTRLEEQIATFRSERTFGIKSGTDTRLASPPGPTVVVHVVPFESFRAGFALDLETAMRQAQEGLLPLGTGSNGHTYTLDGILCYDERPACNAYVQVFRNGVIETASRKLLAFGRPDKVIPSRALPDHVWKFVGSAMEFYHRINVPPPAAAMMSLINVQGFEFATSPEYGFGCRPDPVDREDLILPSVIIKDFSTPAVDLCRPMFDALFNAAGYPKWLDYYQQLPI
ncbi:MAG TPA: hypothetical protein DEH78_15720 [Solibacterales bacterium]|nr:hypothetical protein [Bryobacterales bacterium]